MNCIERRIATNAEVPLMGDLEKSLPTKSGSAPSVESK